MHTERSRTLTTMTAWLAEWGLAKLRKKETKNSELPSSRQIREKPAHLIFINFFAVQEKNPKTVPLLLCMRSLVCAQLGLQLIVHYLFAVKDSFNYIIIFCRG